MSPPHYVNVRVYSSVPLDLHRHILGFSIRATAVIIIIMMMMMMMMMMIIIMIIIIIMDNSTAHAP